MGMGNPCRESLERRLMAPKSSAEGVRPAIRLVLACMVCCLGWWSVDGHWALPRACAQDHGVQGNQDRRREESGGGLGHVAGGTCRVRRQENVPFVGGWCGDGTIVSSFWGCGGSGAREIFDSRKDCVSGITLDWPPGRWEAGGRTVQLVNLTLFPRCDSWNFGQPLLGFLNSSGPRMWGRREVRTNGDFRHLGKGPASLFLLGWPSYLTFGKAEPVHGSEAVPVNPLDFRTDLALWTGVVFVVLLAILGPLAWSPIARALDRREQHLEDQFAAAERRLAEAQALLQQYQQKLEQAAVEAQQILSQARAEAERQAAAILARAHEEAEAEHRRHLIEIQQAAEEAKRLLVQHAAKMAVTIAERVLEAHMDPLTHRKLLNTALSQLVAWEQGDKEFSGTSERGLSPEN